MKYPGDSVLRPGRRVCRVGQVKPVYIGDPPQRSLLDRLRRRQLESPNATWACGALREIKEQLGIVETSSLGTEELWELPLESLKVKHSQEEMTDEQYLYGLVTLRELVADGLKLVTVDSTDVGDKWTYVSWGLHENMNRYLRAESQRPEVWPLGLPRRQDHQFCPLDVEKGPHRGCFYRCLAFSQHGLKRETALFLYDLAIERIKRVSSGH